MATNKLSISKMFGKGKVFLTPQQAAAFVLNTAGRPKSKPNLKARPKARK